MDAVLSAIVPLKNTDFWIEYHGDDNFRLIDRRQYARKGRIGRFQLKVEEVTSTTINGRHYSIRCAYFAKDKVPFTLFFLFRDQDTEDAHVADLRYKISASIEEAKRVFMELPIRDQLQLFGF